MPEPDADQEEPPVAGVYRHAWPNSRLGEIDGGDVAGLEEVEGLGQLRAESGEELAAGGEGGVGWAAAADEDDGGGKGVGAFC